MAQTDSNVADRLPRRFENALLALLQCPTVQQASAQCGLSERTLWRLLQRPDFKRRFDEARRAAFRDATEQLQAASLEAVVCLRRNLNSGAAASEVRAAIAILTLSLHAREQDDLEQRIAALEKRRLYAR